MKKSCQEARALLCERTHGVLATMSVALPGYPLGSLTPYVLNDQGLPVILISEIAQHTANLKQDPRCSLTIIQQDKGEVQAHGRLSVLADARPLNAEESEAAAARYMRFFPEAQGYLKTHDFNFWVLQPVRLRYIGGFGNIHWMEPDELLQANPFAGRGEDAACTHMNNDHADAIASYCRFAGIDCAGHTPQMVGVDAEALYLRIGRQVERLAFKQPIDSMDGLRQETIAMCKPDYWAKPSAA
ncbi:hypothetical protein ATO7_09642 [Oceanococcus atlanticus]|uniref:Uncharacterized protein n=1 Tax=Oceanococcus atlanticus TaxID=1317117 RepID=A0A1Y1SF15_9GAMM|nr:DUF2470 domain-containing protein [Oceanococcus atlanticus]ORE87294.1 hypothetical protein ATO7_09642 [Oceanococcus atlanticus]